MTRSVRLDQRTLGMFCVSERPVKRNNYHYCALHDVVKVLVFVLEAKQEHHNAQRDDPVAWEHAWSKEMVFGPMRSTFGKVDVAWEKGWSLCGPRANRDKSQSHGDFTFDFFYYCIIRDLLLELRPSNNLCKVRSCLLAVRFLPSSYTPVCPETNNGRSSTENSRWLCNFFSKDCKTSSVSDFVC